MTRKYVTLALANWEEDGIDSLLLQLCGDHSDIPDAGFVQSKDQPLTPERKERAIKEIRYNAALALARRGSDKTPWGLVAEALDEPGLQEKLYADNPGMATTLVLKALHDLQELRRTRPEVLDGQAAIVGTLTTLADSSPTIAIKVEAAKALRG